MKCECFCHDHRESVFQETCMKCDCFKTFNKKKEQ